jgi:hypothetical protein
MMRDRLECPACGKRDFWHVAEVLERDMGVTRMPVWIDAGGQLVGSFELLLCASCGLAEWWAHGIDLVTQNPLRRPSVTTSAPECPSCRGTEAWDIPMQDQATGTPNVPMMATSSAGRPAGRLSTWVCRGAKSEQGCGLTRWRVATDRPIVPDYPLRTETCRACRGTRAIVAVAIDATIRPATRAGMEAWRGEVQHSTRFVAGGQGFWGPKWWGRFELRACPDCGHVDWLGTSLDQLEERPNFGIRKLSGGPSTRGPYR